jgi:DNA polymerase III delta prime subunit
LIRDRDVAQEVIKEIAQSHAPSTAAGALFKVIVLNEVDNMSRDAQVRMSLIVPHIREALIDKKITGCFA